MKGAKTPLREELEAIARREIGRKSGSIPYRLPLFGYAAAGDEGFARLSELASAEHVTPEALLSGVRTVMVIFLPFGEPVVESNRQEAVVSRLWVEAYVASNELLAQVAKALVLHLEDGGYRALAIAPTGEFNEETLQARWSHRHAAVLAGLGQLGRNRMLITEKGCAGRLASLLTTASLDASSPVRGVACTECGECIRACPIGALGDEGEFGRRACYRWLLQMAALHSDLKDADACGKCVTGRCSLGPPH